MIDKGDILVVDDTPANLKLLTSTLAEEGYQVRPADSGESALASVAARPPELILLDIRMPGMDGFEVCRRLKARAESRAIPVLFISAIAESDEKLEGFRLGAVDFIAMPIRKEELRARVATHLELSRLHARLEKQAEDLRALNERIQNENLERRQAEDRLVAERSALAKTNAELEEARRSALNTTADAVKAKKALEEKNRDLRREIAEREQAVQKLRESEYLLSKSQKVGQLGSFRLDLATGVWRGSPTLGDIVGIDADYPRDTNGMLELVVPEQRQEISQFLKHVYGERGRFEKEFRIIRPADRKERWLLAAGEIECDERGRPIRMIGTMQDITEHKTATLELQKAKEFADNLIQTANSFIVGLDVNGRIKLFNKAAEEATGYTHDEAAVRNWFEMIVPRRRYPQAWTEFARLLNDERPARSENPILTKSGEERFMAWQSSVVREQGRVVGTISFGMDITERKRVEEELRKHREHLEEMVTERTGELHDSEEMFRRMTASARSAIIMINGEGKITFWNEAAERTFGWASAEVIGRDAHALLAPARYHAGFQRGLPAFQRTGQGPVIGKNLEMMAVRRTGEEFPVEIALSAIQLKGQWHALGIINDVTQRKQAAEAIQRNTEELETFNRAMIGREKRMIELKEEVNRLCALLNQPPVYPPIWRQTNPPAGGPEGT